MSVSSFLAGIAVEMSPESMPAEVRTKIGMCLLDFLAASLDGLSRPPGEQAIEAALRAGGSGTSTIVGTRSRVHSTEAAFANAVLAGCTAQMDTFASSASHPGVVVFPALLACDDPAKTNGTALMAAVAAGYEVMGRLGDLMYNGASSFVARPTGILGPVATAAALARLHELDRRQATVSLSIAANTGAGLMEWALHGTTEFVFHAGFAVRNGMLAHRLAQAGAEASPSTFEGRSGLAATFCPGTDLGARMKSAAASWQILDVSHKPAPACIFVQAPCQAALALVRAHRFDPEEVSEISIHAHPSAVGYPGCDNALPPQSPQDARMSIQFSVCAVLKHGEIASGNWSTLDDPAIAALMARTCLIPFDEGSHAQSAGARSCSVSVKLKSGAVICETLGDMRALSAADIESRFVFAAQRAHREASTIENVIGWSRDLTKLPSIERLLAAIAPA